MSDDKTYLSDETCLDDKTSLGGKGDKTCQGDKTCLGDKRCPGDKMCWVTKRAAKNPSRILLHKDAPVKRQKVSRKKNDVTLASAINNRVCVCVFVCVCGCVCGVV